MKSSAAHNGAEHLLSPSPSSSPLACDAAARGGDDDKMARSRCGLDLLPEPEEEPLALRYAATSRVAFTLNQYSRA